MCLAFDTPSTAGRPNPTHPALECTQPYHTLHAASNASTYHLHTVMTGKLNSPNTQ